MASRRPPVKLPELLKTKISKTGETRGAGADAIYQNRVSRSNTVLIPYNLWDQLSLTSADDLNFEKGFIFIIKPNEYFGVSGITETLNRRGIVLGENALIFYQLRSDWDSNNPESLDWEPANSRQSPLLGKYVARIPATTASEDNEKIYRGFNVNSLRGAGIRLFEYASNQTINECKIQLEACFWLCYDSIEIATRFGMSRSDAETRKRYSLSKATQKELLNFEQLISSRILNRNHETVCPLCMERLSGLGFFKRMAQAEGREVHNLTITEVNLFHINELKYGEYNHRTYNLGWGHHHCNVVVKDAGINETITWMSRVISRNIELGHFSTEDPSA